MRNATRKREHTESENETLETRSAIEANPTGCPRPRGGKVMTKVEAIVREYDDGFALDIPEEARCLFPPNGDQHTNNFAVKSNPNLDLVWVSDIVLVSQTIYM